MENLDEDAMEPCTEVVEACGSKGMWMRTYSVESMRIMLPSFVQRIIDDFEQIVQRIREVLLGKNTVQELLARRTLEELLGKITVQSLRTSIHAKNSSASVLQLSRDLLSVVISSDLLISFVLEGLENCIDQVLKEIFLEKLFAHLLASAIVVLFEYLMGYIERGSWATYSDTSWEFRATYVSIELRLAAYFWFKFRARAGAGIPSVRRNKRLKYEPRLKAYLRPGENARDVWLGEYDTFQEAAEAYWIGAFYYDRWDRFSDEVFSWCVAINLPSLPSHLSDEDKKSWVRGQAEGYLTRRRHQDEGAVAVDPHLGVVEEPHPGVVEEPYPGVTVEHYQAGGYGVPVISGTGEGGSLLPIDYILRSSPPPCEDTEFMLQTTESDGPRHPDFTGTSLEQRDFKSITVEDYSPWAYSTDGEVSGQGAGSEGLTPLRTTWDQSVYNQQDVQHLQQNHGSATVFGGGGDIPEGGAILRQDESEQHPAVPRAFANHTQAMDLRIVAQEVDELKITKRMRSTFQELRGRGWDFELEPCVSTELSIAFSKCEGRKRPKITGTNFLAFQEIHEQGFNIILEPLNNASPQDANERPQSRSGSRDLCSSCNVRLSAE